jgi:trimethylamine:corrinoid methyltransferase-like protein
VAPPGPQRLYAAASVADNQWVSDDPPMDSPATVEALLEWLALNDDTLALDAMREVFRQGKTFLDHDHTLRHFREWWRPRLIRWGSSESGSERAVLDRAREMWKDHLSRYEPPGWPDDILRALDRVAQAARRELWR